MCLFFLLSAVNTYPLIFSLGSVTLNYTAFPWQHDWWFNSWLIAHGSDIIQSILTGSYFLDDVFYPLGTPTSLYVQSLFATIISRPLISVFPLSVVINLLIILSLTACGYATYLLGRHILKNDFFGLIAGCIFCSSPILIAQAKSHFVVLSTIFAIPLFVLFLIKTTESPTFRHSIFLSLSATVLAAGYLYFLNMLFVFTAIFLIHQFIQHKIHLIHIKYYLTAFFLFLPFFTFILYLLLHGSGFSIGSVLSQIRSESVDILAFFLSDVDHPIFGSLANEIRSHFLNNPILHSVYLGVPVLFFSIWSLISRHNSTRFWIFSALLFSVLSLGPVVHLHGKAMSFGLPQQSGYMPYMLYYLLLKPFVISDCSMFFIPGMLFWSLLASAGIHAFVSNRSKEGRTVLLALILCLMAFDYLSIPHTTLRIPDPGAFKIIRDDRDNASILNLPYRNDMISYLYIQSLCEKKMLNPGYPRRLDDDLRHYGDNFPVFARLKDIKDLSQHILNRDDLKAASDFQWFFNLKYIIIHKRYLKDDEVLSACRDFIVNAFSAVPVHEDSDFLILKLKSIASSGLLPGMPKNIDFSAQDQGSVFSGWSYPEKDDSGRTWRWSDGNQSVLILKTDAPEDYIMRCNLSPFICDRRNRQNITIFLNGGRLVQIDLSEGWRTYDVLVPRKLLRIGHNRFTFSYGYVCNPLENGMSSDSRFLAVAFDSIAFIRP